MAREHKVEVKRTVYYSVQFQRDYDPSDGMETGYYARCGSDPDGQSDFVLGPYKTEVELHRKVPARIRGQL